MIKNIRNVSFRYNFIIFFLVTSFFFSCVYYNTFYNAEVNYKKAEKIIEQTPPTKSGDDEIPSQAKKLLGKAIENSNLVIDLYPESKYVDDAYFMIGKSSFLRKEFFKAEKYLKKLLELYPNSEYYNETKIWLVYTYLKMDSTNLAKHKMDELKELKDVKYQYLLNNILAEIAIKDTLPFKAYEYYNKCIDLTSDKSQKTSIYLNLLNIAKNEENLDSSVIYLEKIAEYGSDQMKKDMKLEWIKYSRKAKNFDEVLVEIDIMLGQPQYSSIYIKLELERAKIYLDQNDFESAKIFFSELSEKYSRKNESAEALFHLGYIALMESFDLELALEYFEKSKKDRRSSVFGKRSRDMINRINDYKNLHDELDLILSDKVNGSDGPNTDNSIKNNMTKEFMPKPQQKTIYPDSILFVISEKLLFDFDRVEDAKNSYKRLIEEYPDSKFRAQALYVLNFYFPDEEWNKIIDNDYPESEFNLNDEVLKENLNTIELKRDNIWRICDSSYNLCAEEFLKLYNSQEDNLSLYFYAFINDTYLNNLEKSVNAYMEYTHLEPNSEYFNEINNRLNKIEDSIHSGIELANQKINYYHAIQSLRSGENLDSTIAKFNKSTEGGFSKYKSSAQLIKARINNLINLNKQAGSVLELINKDSLSINDNRTNSLDSLYFIIAKIYQLDFMINDTAKVYLKKIATNFIDSKYRYQTITSLKNIEVDNENWKNLLIKEYPDSLHISDSSYKQISIIEDIDDGPFIKSEINKLEMLTQFKDLFSDEKDSISIIDTININMQLDTLNKVFENNEQ